MKFFYCMEPCSCVNPIHVLFVEIETYRSITAHNGNCCDMGQNDTIGKIELNPSIVLSSDNTNCKNDIQLFHQLFDELSVYRDYH